MNLYDVKYLPTKDWVVGNRVTKKERKRESAWTCLKL